LTFAGHTAEPHPLDVVHQVGRQLARVQQVEERTTGVEGRHHDRRPQLGAVVEGDADGTAVPGEHGVDPGAEPDLRAVRLGRPGEDLGEATVAALVERPGAEVPVVLAHLVEQQHQSGTGRHRPDLRADDAGRRVEALDGRVLEVVLDPVRGAAGQQPDDVVHHLPVDTAEVVEQPLHVGLVLGVLAEDVGRRVVEERLDRLADQVEVVVVAVVGVGVVA
jgi:hypothetical protein